MMEESHPESHDDANIAEQLEEAAQTTVTQASPPAPTPVMTSTSSTPPRVIPSFPLSSAHESPNVSNVPRPTPFSPPSQFVSPGPVLPAPTVGGFPPTSPPGGYAQPVSGVEGIPPPPTGGFVPSHTVSTTPAKGHIGALPPSPVGITPTLFTPPTVPVAATGVGISPDASNAGRYADQSYAYSPSPTTYPAGSSDYAVNTGFEVISQDSAYVSPPPQKSEGLFGWFSGAGLVNKVIEKTKSSVETMITTLDPGMKEVIYSGGDIDVIVTSKKEVKVGAVRQAFQEVFGRATVTGIDSQPAIAPQPVGYTAGLKGAEERIQGLRRSGHISERHIAVSVENFIAELLPDKWFDIGCVLLKDPSRNIELQVFTQSTPVPYQYVASAQEQTPADYNLRWSGLSVTVGQAIQQVLPHVDHADWHRSFTGVSRRELIYLAAKSLATMYRAQLYV